MIVNKLTQSLGAMVRPGNFVKIHYTGRLSCGKIFDCSMLRGVPLEFQLGVGHVIKGLDEGIAQLQVG